MKEHLSVIQLSSKGMTTYLSPTIQNELIEFLGKKVKHLILEEIKAANIFPFYSIVLALIVRYEKVDSSEVGYK